MFSVNFKRLLDLKKIKTSAFLFGPRMTGKTFLLRGLKFSLFIDLLDPEKELALRQSPREFWEYLLALAPQSLVIVDEIQRVPALLNYVQKGIEERGLRFFLSGSSVRKLKRGGANLLGGRAADLRLHPLTVTEIASNFNLEEVLQYGTLPKIVQLVLQQEYDDARRLLRAYYTTYIKEEIQAEALTRNLEAFQRFLKVAAQGNAQVTEFANISRECSVPMSTVKEYYSILEDTLIGEFLWPWDRSERKKARPKFYFFDCGVIRAIQNQLQDPPTPEEKGTLFEMWFIRELMRYRDYGERPHEFSFWREGNHEMDLLISGHNGPLLAFEIKSGKTFLREASLKEFQKRFPKVPVLIASATDTIARHLESGVEILPWPQALKRYQAL